jgi:uncharacterized membrane protein YfhO
VDGKPVEAKELFHTFLAIELDAGTHKVSLRFRPQGLSGGMWITTASAVTLAAVTAAEYCMKPGKKKRRSANEEIEE